MWLLYLGLLIGAIFGWNDAMPFYHYQCTDCTTTDRRVAGPDDHTAVCVACGGLMLRLDDPFAVQLWDEKPEPRHGL